jgi:hypothetical protein
MTCLMPRPKSRKVLAFLILAAATTALFWPPSLRAAQGDIQMSYENHLLTLKAEDADIKKILFRISDRTGIYIRVPEAIDKQVTIDLVDIPLAKAFKKILRGLNHAIIYGFLKDRNRVGVAEVYVFQKSKGGSSGRPRPRPRPRSYGGSSQRQNVTAKRIQFYEQRIQSMSERLAKIDADSPQGKRYQRQLQNYQEALERLRNGRR